MTILLDTIGDPIWQVLTIAFVLAALLMLMVVRTRDAHLSAARKRLESRLVLVVCLVVFVLMSGGEVLLHSQQASSPQGSSRTSTTIPTSVPRASPTHSSDPSPSPTPTATPRLARSITSVLTTISRLHHPQGLPDGLAAIRAFASAHAPGSAGHCSMGEVYPLQHARSERGPGGLDDPDLDSGSWLYRSVWEERRHRLSIHDERSGQRVDNQRDLHYHVGGLLRDRLGLTEKDWSCSQCTMSRAPCAIHYEASLFTGGVKKKEAGRPMQVIMESLGDPIWQIGVGSIALIALVLILVLRSPDVRLTPWQHWFLPRIIALVCLSLFLVLSTGVVFSHGADATPTSVHATRSHPSVTATPPVIPSPTSVPTPTPSPFPHLSPTPAQVLTTFCNAIDQHDLNGAWEQYATRLQKERTEPPPPHGWFKIVECSIGEVSDTSATGLLQLQTIEPGGYADGVERPFQFTLSVEDGAWKITQIARCFSDGCLDITPTIVPW